jgi:preprotein translocase subunit SecB
MKILKKKMISKKFTIMSEFIKDMSSETPDIQTYLFVKDNISKYHLNIEIISKAIKDKIIEVNTTLKFSDNDSSEKKANFEMIYASIIKIEDEINDKKDLQKIILCDVQNKVYPNLEKAFLNLLHNSGFPEIRLDKKINFTELYKQRSN